MRQKWFWVTIVGMVIFRILYYFSTLETYPDGTKLRIISQIASEPVRYETSQYLKLRGLKIYLPLYPEISYGDTLVIEGVVQKDKLTNPELKEIKQTRNLLYTTRKKLVGLFEKSLPQPHASLVAGMVLGSKSGIPSNFWEDLKFTGTAHVVVASGMNVAFVAGFIMTVLAGVINRKKAVVVSLFAIWGYAILSGFDAPIVRATIMGSIAFSALILGRMNFAWRGLFLSALVMLIFKPEWVKDLGFILSFSATASLMLFQGKISKTLKKLKVPKVIIEDLSTSLAAQILVAPILFITFGQLNILSPLINALVLWTVPVITGLGFVAASAGLIVPALGQVILYLVYPFTLWFVTIVKLASW